MEVAIIGSGPAALSAGIYLGRAGVKATILERGPAGGELNKIDKITNYPGFEGSGAELAKIMQKQAEAVGVKVTLNECYKVSLAKSSKQDGDRPSRDSKTGRFLLETDNGETSADAVLIATGSMPRPLAFTINKPVSYCAICDGVLAKDKRVAVVGGGNAAAQSALYLAPTVEHVTLVTHSKLKADQYLQEKLQKLDNFRLVEDLEPTPEYLNDFDHVFVYIGKAPAIQCLEPIMEKVYVNKESGLLQLKLAKTMVACGDDGYLITGNNKHYPHQTTLRGLFAAGDVRSNAVRQAITAAGDGAAAALEIIKYLKD